MQETYYIIIILNIVGVLNNHLVWRPLQLWK